MKKRTGPRMARALKMTRDREGWAAILAWCGQRQQRDLMVQAAERQQQPLTAIVDLMCAEFGKALDHRATKMFVGTAIAGVMEEAGFEPVSTGERIPANVAGFRTGARYVRSPATAEQPAADDAETDDGILLTMLAALSDSQRRRLSQMIANSAA